MEILINTRGNGACALCRKWRNCPILTSLQDGVRQVEIRKVSNDHPVEAVIYSCPAFEED